MFQTRACRLLAAALFLSGYHICVEGETKTDAPAVITEVSPASLRDPESYVQIAKTGVSQTDVNELKCVATNANNVIWKYKPDPLSEFQTIPSAMVEQPLQDNGKYTTRILTDRDNFRSLDRFKLSGYYQCYAIADYFGTQYQTLTPPIRMIYPEIEGAGEQIGTVDAATIYNERAVAGTPYRLPCIRAPDITVDKFGFKLVPSDAAELPQASVRFTWIIRDYANNEETAVDLESARYKNRVKMDPRTGDLYFAVLNENDAARVGSSNRGVAYECKVVIADRQSVLVNSLYLNVQTNTEAGPAVKLQYPLKTTEHSVKCVEKRLCKLAAIFGGTESVTSTLNPVPPEDSSVSTKREIYGVSFDSATTDESGNWTFNLVNPSGQTIGSTVITLTVLAYPVLENIDNFPKRAIEFTGSEVFYKCEPKHTDVFGVNFFVNGVEVKDGQPGYVEFNRALPNQFWIRNVTSSTTVACVATNNAGTMFELSTLTVYDAPKIQQHPLASKPYEVESWNRTEDGLIFNCSFKLDAKTTANSVKLYWRSNRKGLEDEKITGDDDNGVKGVRTTSFNRIDASIDSELIVEITSITTDIVRNTQWWCECSYDILGETVPVAKSELVLLTILAEPGTTLPQAPPFKWTAVIIGAVLGFLFLILIIILLHCYVQKNKGEQYYVDEKERKAGHNPEEEMKQYEFVDYNRPDQNPVKGSRASMNFSDRPMESDHGSMDEYGGDIDTGRFNEDGSFIGEYREPNNHRNQADV